MPSPPRGDTPSDPHLGKIVVERGFVTPDQLSECVAEQQALRSRGENLLLGQVLLKKGYLTVNQLLKVLEDQRRDGAGTWKRPRRWKAWAIACGATVFVALLAAEGFGRWSRSKEIRSRMDRARALEEAGRSAEAREEYRVLLELDRDRKEAREGFARTQGELDRREALVRDRARAREEALRDLEKARPLLEQASRGLYRSDLSAEEVARQATASQGILQSSLEKDPDSAAAHHLLGQTWELLGWWDRAEASWRKAVALDPRHGAARYRLGRILLTRAYLRSTYGRSKEEIASQQEDVERLLDEGSREIRRSMAEGADEMERDLAEAILAYARQDWEALAKRTRVGIDRFPDQDGREEFYLLAAAAAVVLEDKFRALDEAIRIRPKFALAWLHRGYLCHTNGRLEDAIASYSKAIEVHPRLSVAYYNRGVARRDRGERDLALADLSEAIRLNPEDTWAYLNRAMIRQKAGDLERAIADYTETIRLDSRFPGAIYSRGTAYAAARRYEEAIADFDRTLRDNPKDTNALIERGLAYVDAGDFDRALADYSKAIEVDPECAVAYLNRGILRRRQKMPKEAAEDFSAAIGLRPEWAMAY